MNQKDPNAKEGGRIRVVSMIDDPNPVPPGTEGTIRLVDGMGIIHVNWDNGRTLGLIPGIDTYQLLSVGVDYGKDIYDKTTEMFDSLNETSSGGSAIKSAIKKTSSVVNKSMPKATKVSSGTNNTLKSAGIKTSQVSNTIKSANIKDIKVESNEIKGGKADNISIKGLAKKHKISIEDVKKEIKLGISIEKEHVGNDIPKAKEIAMDHVFEFKDYYSNKRYGVVASEKGLKKSKKEEENTDYMTTTASVGGVNGMGYTSPSAWGEGPLKPKKRKKVSESTTTFNTDRTEGIAGLEFADLDHDGWFFDDVPFWKGGKIVDPNSKVKNIVGGEKFWGPNKGPKSAKTKSDKITTLKKEDLLRMVDTRLNESSTYLKKEDLMNIVESKKIEVDLEKGDDILTGKFKNRKDKVKKIGKDEKNQPTVNDKPMLKFRIPKLIPKKEIKEEELDETTTFGSVWGVNGPPVGPAFAAKKGQWKMAKKPIWIGGTIVQQDDNEGIMNPISEENKVKFVKGGKYVKIKDKCAKYNNGPHCSQGAIDDPLILSDETIKNIHEISKQTGKPFNEVYRVVQNNIKLR